MAGRVSLLTEELRAKIERELATGATRGAVSERTGVTERSLNRWIADGKIRRPEPVAAPVPPAPKLQPGVPLTSQVANAEEGLVATIIKAAQGGRWQAAAWLLERALPERWGKPDVRLLAPPPGPNPFDELDELAARRRNKP